MKRFSVALELTRRGRRHLHRRMRYAPAASTDAGPTTGIGHGPFTTKDYLGMEEERISRRLLERLIRHAFEQWLSRPDGLQMQQLGRDMWSEDREVDHVSDDYDIRNREEGRA